MTLHFFNDNINDVESTRKAIIIHGSEKIIFDKMTAVRT